MTRWQTYKHGGTVLAMIAIAVAMAVGVAMFPAGALVWSIESYTGKAVGDGGNFVWFCCSALLAPFTVGMFFKDSHGTLLESSNNDG